jgi:hypothetical protein
MLRVDSDCAIHGSSTNVDDHDEILGELQSAHRLAIKGDPFSFSLDNDAGLNYSKIYC